MGNTKALYLLANSHEFDEKYHEITYLMKMLGSFILYALPMHMRTEKNGPSMMRGLGEFNRCAITISTWDRRNHGIEVVFGFRDRRGDPVLSKAQLDLEMVRYLHDNLDVFVQISEECCQKYDVLADFQKQMARFGM